MKRQMCWKEAGREAGRELISESHLCWREMRVRWRVAGKKGGRDGGR